MDWQHASSRRALPEDATSPTLPVKIFAVSARGNGVLY
jgi:hypothetical protein